MEDKGKRGSKKEWRDLFEIERGDRKCSTDK